MTFFSLGLTISFTRLTIGETVIDRKRLCDTNDLFNKQYGLYGIQMIKYLLLSKIHVSVLRFAI